jgi:hypothetical protein
MRALGAAAIAAATLAGASAAAGGAAAAPVRCPPFASTTPPGAVQWIFSELGAPQAPSGRTTRSWTRGQGSWSAGRATGAICADDTGGGHRDAVLAPAGAAALSPQIKRLGLLGVGIAIGVRVSASDDPACAVGTRGTVTLFASYYSVHRDTIALHFGAGCADHDHRFAGQIVHVEIDRGGKQVNSA